MHSGDDIEEMVLAVKHSMQQCCLQLKAKLAKRQAAQQQRERKQILAKHIPNAAQAFMDVLNVCYSLILARSLVMLVTCASVSLDTSR